jgi:hypothetical protein
MHRFTSRDDAGKAWIGPSHGGISPAERFAAYEETGLEPEKIVILQKAFALACRILEDNFGGLLMSDEDPQSWQEHLLERAENEQICRVCGCTQENGCPEGCWWVEPDLCSSCAERIKEEGGGEDGD